MPVIRIALAAAVSFCVATATRAQSAVDQLGWLMGCWRSTSPQTIIDEQWMAPRGGTMLGMARTVRGDQTTDYELVLITMQGGRLTYKAHPSGQASATFTATTASETAAVFENPAHDFPQTVGYRRQGADLLQAWIEGRVNDRSRRIDFSYKRVACDSSGGVP